MKKTAVILAFAASALALLPVAASAQLLPDRNYPGANDQERLQAFLADPAHSAIVAKAKAGDPVAMVTMADIVWNRLYPDQTDKQAVLDMRLKLLGRAMEKKYAPAFLTVGRGVRKGEFASFPHWKAYDFLIEAARLGDVDGLMEARRVAVDADSCPNCEPRKDVFRLVDENGKAPLEEPARFALGKAYLAYKRGQNAEVIGLLQSRYAPRHDRVAEALVSYYLDGVALPGKTYNSYGFPYIPFIVQPDPQKAVKLLKDVDAASPNDSWAAGLLAMYLVSPRKSGIAPNQTESLRYLDRVVAIGDGNAPRIAQALGHELVTGKLYKRDMPRAIKYLEFAAEKGNAAANYDLGLIHRDGMAGTVNNVKAEYYFRQAMNGGSSAGARALAQMFQAGTASKQSDLLAAEYEKRANALAAKEAAASRTNDLIRSVSGI